MITIKNPEQIAKMRDAGKALYEVYQLVRERVVPGVTTGELDAYAESLIRGKHGIPSCLHYCDYPASLCTSVNDEVVHGIPNKKRVLKEGDIISIDSCLMLNGWQSDSAFTVGVGHISDEAQRLIDVTEQCFWAGARMAVQGNRLGDIAHAVQQLAEANGYGVIRDYTGHGIGRSIHEDPTVYNFGQPGHGLRLRQGMTICVEPMIAAGDWHVTLDQDGWTARTKDRSICAHYEHTLAINEKGLPELLTYPGFVWKEEA